MVGQNFWVNIFGVRNYGLELPKSQSCEMSRKYQIPTDIDEMITKYKIQIQCYTKYKGDKMGLGEIQQFSG